MNMATSLFNRINSTQLADRLDGEYYSKNLIENEKKLEYFNQETLENCVQPVRNAISDLTSNGSFEFLRGIQFSDLEGIPYIRTQNLMEGYIDNSDIIYVEKKCRDMVSKSICETGDLIVCRKGKVGAASSIIQKMNGAAISENVTRFRLLNNYDADFLSAFLNSRHGRMRFLREATGVIQKWINNEKLRQIKIINLTPEAEKYIGDKVRQAEELRAWAMALELKFQKQLKTFYPEAFKDKSTGKKHSMAPIEDMSYTLNPGAFDEERLRIRLYLKKCGSIKLKEVASIEGTTSSDYSQDTTYIGLDSISSGTCALSPSNIRKSGVTGTSRILNEGVVVAKLRPYLNKISYIPKSLSGSVGSTELLCVRPLNELNGWYIYGVLKSDIGLRQLKPLASGSTHPRIDQYDLYDLIFPIHQDSEIMGKWLENAQAAYFMASYLVISAKSLVEALIEGQLTEKQLIKAQQTLEDGDNTLDKAILHKLSSEGYAIEGATPLFSDVDELYRLLASATAAADSED